MSKSDPIEKALDRLAEMHPRDPSPQNTDEIRRFLTHKSNLVVSKAAKLVAEQRRSEFVPDLVSAFNRFIANPAQLDKRCAALTGITEALYEMDYCEPGIYLQGLRHVQMEASFGPPVDAAAALRGISAQALLRTRYKDAMAAVLPLLVDREPPARIGAVRALATNGGAAGALLLRLKVLTGDSEPEVVAECFLGLLSSAPEESPRFVADFMDADDQAISDAAIWALGQSRLPAAFEALRNKWERTIARDQRMRLLSGIAMLRLESGIEFLCSIISAENETTASDASNALGTFKANSNIRAAVATAVRERRDNKLQSTFVREFGKNES
jgi:HEAT repeat protein